MSWTHEMSRESSRSSSHPPLVRKDPKSQIVASHILRHLFPHAIDHEMLRASFRFVRRKESSPTLWQQCAGPSLPRSRRGFASVTSIDQSPQLGENLHGFMLKRKKHVPELQLTAFQLEHEKTGAEYLHVARDDKNNVFSVGFKTNPPDHTGVPHILEHTTLCGSQKYVRPIILRGAS